MIAQIFTQKFSYEISCSGCRLLDVLLFGVVMPSSPDCMGEGIVFLGCPVCPFVGQILLPLYLMNGLNNFDKSDRNYSLHPADDLIRFWTSKV